MLASQQNDTLQGCIGGILHVFLPHCSVLHSTDVLPRGRCDHAVAISGYNLRCHGWWRMAVMEFGSDLLQVKEKWATTSRSLQAVQTLCAELLWLLGLPCWCPAGHVCAHGATVDVWPPFAPGS